MNSKHVFLVVLVLLLGVLFTPFFPVAIAGALPQNDSEVDFLVQFKPGLPAQTRRAINSAYHAKEKDFIPGINVYVMSAPGRSVNSLVTMYQKNPNVVFAEPNQIAEVFLTPNDPYYANWQRGIQRMDAPLAWSMTTGCPDTIIAVLDTGVIASHEDLAGKLTSGYNFVNNNADPFDDHGHGTRVIGIIGALGNNGTGVAGTAWLNPVMPVKVMGADGRGSHSNIAKGIVFAVDNGARVINMSLGGSTGSATLKSAVDYAYNRNVLLVAAAGNSNASVSYPAAYANVIAVAAVDNSDVKATYSNYGPEISVSAPGNGVFSTVRTGGYDLGTGTSFAAPFVSGLAGLLLGTDPSMTPAQVQELIEKGAEDRGEPGWDPYTGWGRINLANSLNLLDKPTIDTIPPEVRIVSPQSGGIAEAMVTINVEAADNVAVEKVDLLINGERLQTLYQAPYQFLWDTIYLQPGTYSIAAKAFDSSGNATLSEPVTLVIPEPVSAEPAPSDPPVVEEPAAGEPDNEQPTKKAPRGQQQKEPKSQRSPKS